ncbi:MAG: hypothetical protein Q7T79_00530 [bacterium]|nr:hypothetical protein [bacterium]
MKTKLLITIIILTILLIGGYFMRNYLSGLFGMSNETVLLEWQSKPDAPNLWEEWGSGIKFFGINLNLGSDNLFKTSSNERELIEYYYQDKFNPQKQILNYNYKTHKGPIVLDYKQIKIQDEKEFELNRMSANTSWRKVRDERGLIIQVQIPKKFKDKFLEEGWEIATENNQAENNQVNLNKHKIVVGVDLTTSYGGFYVGTISINNRGALDLLIITEGKHAEDLRKQVDEIKLKKTLELVSEEFEKKDGREILTSKKIDIGHDDPRYIFAVENALNGFDSMVEEVGKEEENKTVSKQEIMSAIKNDFSEINSKINTYKIVEEDMSGESTDGGMVVYYFENKNLKKITATYLGETGKSVNEYYYKNKELIFVLDQNYEYNRPMYYDEKMAKEDNDEEIFDINKSKISEEKYYFYKNKLIMWIDEEKKEVQNIGDAFKNKEFEIIKDSQKLKEK